MRCFLPLVVLLVVHASAQVLPQGALIGAAGVDSNGFIYVAGRIYTADLPTTPGVLVPGPLPPNCAANCWHGFVAKVTPSGDTLVWATYLGGEGVDSVAALAVAADGTVVVAGSTTSKNFQPAPTGYQKTSAGIFILRLSVDGRSLVDGTFFGGSASDTVADLKLDAAGNVYIAGAAISNPFPTTAGAYQRDRSTESPSSGCDPGADEFVAKFNPSLSALLFSTLIVLPGPNAANALALGPDGSLYVAATKGKRSSTCPSRPFVTRLTPDGGGVIYSGVLAASPGAYAITVDSQGFAYVGTDTREAAGFAPSGTLVKLDPQGTTVTSGEIFGAIGRIELKSGSAVVAGSASPMYLRETPGAPGNCLPTGLFTQAPYLALFDSSTLKVSYTGFLNGAGAWLLDRDRILAALPYTTAQPLAILPAGPPPPGTATCTTNSALPLASGAIAPGELVSIYGIGIGPATPLGLQLDAAGNVTSNLNGYAVRVGGLPAPLLYAGLNQINFVTPFGIPSSGKVRVEILHFGALVAGFDKEVAPLELGFFTADASGTGPLAAINQDGTVNSATNPAAPGSAVALYATGFGAMSPQPVDGTRPPLPFSKPNVDVTAFVNASPATIEYVGNAPTLVQGVLQLNVRLPVGVVSDARITVNAGSTSAGGSIYIR